MDRYLADTLLTMSGDQRPIPGGVVDVEEGRVVWSGPANEAPDRGDAMVHRIDGILMPGMVNIHCHTPMVLLRGAGEGLPVDRWLHEVMWPREARLTPEDVRIGMQAGGAELLANGITTSVEMYFHGDAVAGGAADAGLRCLVTAPVIEDAQFDRFGTWQAQLEEMVATRERLGVERSNRGGSRSPRRLLAVRRMPATDRRHRCRDRHACAHPRG